MWSSLDLLEGYSIRCNLSGVVSVQYAVAASLIFILTYSVFICIKGHEGKSAYSFGIASAGCFSYACCNSVGKRNHTTETEWKACKAGPYLKWCRVVLKT